MYKLKGKVQHYAWGGHDYIPQLLNEINFENLPYAEYWMGAHHSSPSLIETGTELVPLNRLLEENKDLLGDKVLSQFGGLPYLFKVLDVKDMLSIQVHPSKAEAEKGFRNENQKGIPLNAANRNYKDDNHKPEVMVALSGFWLLHGFKQKEELEETLMKIAPFNFLLPVFEKEGYYGLYKYVMELSPAKVDAILGPLIAGLLPAYKAQELPLSDPGYWASKAVAAEGERLTEIDRGIFSIYFFNIVYLQPGEGVFQGAGLPHAYLHGQNIELMSNSDNVLRGGLTPKHIDVPELLKHIQFEGITPEVMKGEVRGVETVYPCPVPDFVVSSIRVKKGKPYTHTAGSAEILLVLSGQADFRSPQQGFTLKQGESAFIGAGESYEISTETNAVLYKAAVPV
ncbi:MAG: mannose-6-phosphate isomerase, class I [Chitinophagaceae bacterium]|nr:mannose-6-phosphate isomerase, class I [Chitinophagaceae bacterium]MCW5925912.1 mannose-6-phosphate isomerase, class I [Chitinophagaceae bacterium]